ncbi:MAG: HDOD domain-containing protein [Planctomycetes bacterium]|nr:HDOD domain-containing protein [Planctomycetota bacterium]
MSVSDEKTRRVLRNITEVPTLPEVVNRLLDTINDPDSSAGDVSGLVEQDAALAARVLRMVNSSFYGLSGKVATIQRAIVILGFSTVKQLALGVSVIDFFDADADVFFDPSEFWAHSLRTATACKTIVGRTGRQAHGDLFVQGLLHDLGKIIERQFMRTAFMRVVRLHQREGVPFRVAEERILELNHADVGQYLAEQWRFPPDLVAPVAHHHDPFHAGVPADLAEACMVVYLANLLAHRLENEADGGRRESAVDPRALERLGLAEAGLEGIAAEVKARAADVISLFQ